MPEEDLTEFKNRVDKVLPEIVNKYDLKYQVDESHKSLKYQWDAINGIEMFYNFEKNLSCLD